MSDARLPTHLSVAALLRRVNDAGGMGMVRARGDADAGMVLIVASERGDRPRLLERGFDGDGARAWMEVGPDADDPEAREAYWRRRRARDPDLWVIELDIASVERFIAETAGFY